MQMGIVAATDLYEVHVVGLARAALERGWPCRCFFTDRGVRLLSSRTLRELLLRDGMVAAMCEHSWQAYGSGEPPAGVAMASQYQNAELAHLCDRVVVL
jgi:hypothetical protein